MTRHSDRPLTDALCAILAELPDEALAGSKPDEAAFRQRLNEPANLWEWRALGGAAPPIDRTEKAVWCKFCELAAGGEVEVSCVPKGGEVGRVTIDRWLFAERDPDFDEPRAKRLSSDQIFVNGQRFAAVRIATIMGEQPVTPDQPALSERPSARNLVDHAPRHRRGPKAEKFIAVIAAMKSSDPISLKGMKEEEMAARYGASRDTCRRARAKVLSELVDN